MYRTFKSIKDTYIVDRVVRGHRSHAANVGRAGTMDIYKLYGATKSGSNSNNELTRGLIKFDLQDLKDDFAAGLIDVRSPKFNCTLRLIDVYGGQTTPSNFTLAVLPLSKSFDEGVGRDVVFYQDKDVCNFLTASATSTWVLSGANAKGTLGNNSIDVIVSGNLGAGIQQLWMTQSFIDGSENLELDITQYVSGVLVGLIADHGFRISFIEDQENDTETRFAKRFVTRNASDPTKHPSVIVRYDDSIQSNVNNFVFDYPGTLYFYNNVRGTLRNIILDSNSITGSNCLLLNLKTPISGGYYTLTYTGSQHTFAGNQIDGTYSASFTVPSSDSIISQKIAQSGSVSFDLIWGSLNGSIGFYTSSTKFVISPPKRGGTAPSSTKYYVNAMNVSQLYKITDKARIRVFVENVDMPYAKLVKQFYISPSCIPERTYYSIRNAISNEVIVDFDDVLDSTRLSSDESTLWFDFDMSNLYIGELFEIDIMIIENGLKRFYRGASGAFRIESTI